LTEFKLGENYHIAECVTRVEDQRVKVTW